MDAGKGIQDSKRTKAGSKAGLVQGKGEVYGDRGVGREAPAVSLETDLCGETAAAKAVCWVTWCPGSPTRMAPGPV